jgi:hypothetical protein
LAKKLKSWPANVSFQHQRIGYCTLDNATNNDTAVTDLGRRYKLEEGERIIWCAAHFIHLTARAMLYGDESKSVTMEELLGPNGDPNFANATQEIKDELNTIRSEESDDSELQNVSVSDEDFISEE